MVDLSDESHQRAKRCSGFSVTELIVTIVVAVFLVFLARDFYKSIPPEVRLKSAAGSIVENAGNWRNHTSNLGLFKKTAVEMGIDRHLKVLNFEEAAHSMTQFGTTMVERLEEMEKERSEKLWASFLARVKAKGIEIDATAEFRRELKEFERQLKIEIPKLSEERAEMFGKHFRDLTDSYGELLKFLEARDK